MRRTLPLLLTLLAACGTVTGTTTTGLGPTTPTAPAADPVTVDLADDALLASLGAPRPQGLRWSRPVAGSELVGTTRVVDPVELRLVDEALRLLPAELGPLPRVIARTPLPPAATGRTDPSAVAIGPDIYLFDDTFARDGLPIGPLGLARIVAHEIVHIAQFATLDPFHVGEIVARGGRVDLTRSTLTDEFVAATGWTVVDDAWRAPTATSTAYGATHPLEDMAEAVSLVVTGLGDSVPDAQRAWVETWLSSPAEALAAGMPWAPAGSEEVVSASALWDETAVDALGGSLREYMVYRAPVDAADGPGLATAIQQRLRDRGVAGTLGKVDDDRISRWSGRFDRPDGIAMWVELWDFRNAPGFAEGPDAPVISYVLVWP